MLTNSGGPEYLLRDNKDKEMRPAGYSYDMREFGDQAYPVGNIYFSPGHRVQPIESTAELVRFAQDNPQRPIAMHDGHEVPQLILGAPVLNKKDEIAVNKDGTPVFRFVGFASDNNSRALDPAVYLKDGVQYSGVDVLSFAAISCNCDVSSELEVGLRFQRFYREMRQNVLVHIRNE